MREITQRDIFQTDVRKATLESFIYQGFVQVSLLGYSPKYSFQFGCKHMQSKALLKFLDIVYFFADTVAKCKHQLGFLQLCS